MQFLSLSIQACLNTNFNSRESFFSKLQSPEVESMSVWRTSKYFIPLEKMQDKTYA